MRQIINLDAHNVKLDQAALHRALGYPDSSHASAKVQENLPNLIDQAKGLAQPIGIAGFETIEQIKPGRVQIKNGPAFHGPRLSMAMQPDFKIALFALTLGQEICDWLNDLCGSDVWTGFLADAVASELVEAAADELQARITDSLGPPRHFSTLRYSPGYCDWPVDEMPSLLLHLGASEIGIELSAGGMMTPQKSICGVIGFSGNPDAVDFIPCETCPDEDCDHRRKKE